MKNNQQTVSAQELLTSKGGHSNTPPLNTRGIEKPLLNQVVIDWFEFTMPSNFLFNNRYKSLKNYLGYEGASFVSAPRGLSGYSKQIHFGKTKILYGGTEEMGVHVILSGDAIRDMTKCILNFIHWVLHHEGKVTRIDIALDDVTGNLKINKIKKHIKEGALTCRSRGYRYMRSGDLKGNVTGETVYFGSAQSRTQYRIYDKAQETGLNNGHWVRCEGQYRHENAHSVAEMVHASKFDLGMVFTGLLRGYLRFLEPSEKKNKSRWAVVSWWETLLTNTNALKLSVQKAVPSMERARTWFSKQVAPTFAMLLNYYGSDDMKEMYELGFERLTGEQKQMCIIPF